MYIYSEDSISVTTNEIQFSINVVRVKRMKRIKIPKMNKDLIETI